MPQPKLGKSLPKTKVHYEMITLSDRDPATKLWTTFSFPRRMIAWPLSNEGPGGWGPDNKAAWWPYFQERHKIGPLYWVQGHMLNDNIHGPGEPRNLVPITNTLNTNMLGIVERFVKRAVSQGRVLYYEVAAHWEGATKFGSRRRNPPSHDCSAKWAWRRGPRSRTRNPKSRTRMRYGSQTGRLKR